MKAIEQRKQSGAYIFRPRITINGVTYCAKDYGKRAFRIPIRKDTA